MKNRSASDEEGPSHSKHGHGSGRAALAWANEMGRGDDLMQRVEASVKRTRRRRIAAASVCLVGIFVLAGITRFEPHESPMVKPNAASSSAVVSHPAMRSLADGSLVELNHGADMVVQFTSAERRILLRYGEAHFAVKPDPARPFIVVASGVEVRAVGTAFAVQLGSDAVEVVVTHGTVAVDRSAAKAVTPPAGAIEKPTPAAPPLALVDAGNRLVVEISPQPSAPPPSIVAVTGAELNDRLSWRVPRLEFAGTPLAEAIPMFKPPEGVKLVLDPALGHLQMSGILRADNIDSLVRLLKNEFGIEVERRGDHEVYLRRP